MFPATIDRVPANTADFVNEQIREQTDANVARYESRSRQEINDRLEELEREWDVERTIEANASSLMIVGLGLGTFVDRRFYALPAVIAGFLLQHAIQGWCPPIPVLRRLGVRTQSEIDEERYALKAMRGDFEDARAARKALHAVRK
jgi:hypothetical protein